MTAEHAATRDAARRNTRLRFEQWAKNPGCEANTLSAVHNVRMPDVARAAGVPVSFGQSPFALARGDQFERSILAKDGERLADELRKARVLPAGQYHFVDLRLRMNGGAAMATLDEAIDATNDLLRSAAADPTGPPLLVAAATVRLQRGVMLPEANLIIDALVVLPGTGELIVGEVKTYPDRGGYTDPAQLAGARAQAGLYVHALRSHLPLLGLESGLTASATGFLVLTRPGSNWPSVRAGEDLEHQAVRAHRGFDLLEDAATKLPGPWSSPAGSEDGLIEAVLTAETEYGEACLSFCDLAPRCHAVAEEEGDPVVLGDDFGRFLGEIDLFRAVALLEGAPCVTPAEVDLVERIGLVEAIYR